MAYKINNTFGTLLVTLADGTIDTTTTDLTLIGKGYAGFGEKLNENIVKLLENFNNTSAPSNKITGQLWYDQTNKQINVYTGSKWKPVGSSSNSTTSPTNAVQGDMWFDTSNTQLYVYTGTAWTLIGPTTVAGSGVTSMITETVQDNAGVNKTILKGVQSDTVVFVISGEAFTPSSSETNAAALITAGFSTVAQGIQLSSSVASAKFRGTATDSDALGGVTASQFLRSDANDTSTGTLGLLVDGAALTLGAGSDITLTMASDNLTIANTTSNKDIIFTVNDGGVTTTLMTLDGSAGKLELPSCGTANFAGDVRITGNLTVDGDSVTQNVSTLTVEDNIIELNRNISSNSGMPTYTGLKVNRGETSVATEQDLFWVWDESFADDGTTIYGNAGGAWTAFKSGGGTEMSASTLVDLRANVVHATSTAAQYADLAERYASDMALESGDVVMLGGSEEVTKCNKELCDYVFGVVSDSPAFLMNAQAGNNDSHPMIALKGRVLVKLKGTGNAGDRIVSAGNGEAKVVNLDECTAFNVLGRLLKHKYNEETTLTECVIGVK
jgi:hypothetical protein